MRKNFRLKLVVFVLCLPFLLQAQAPKVWKAGEIYAHIQKLQFLGSAMYVAAHPDDENQRVISYFSNHLKARTAYLSMTRGDGGQNEIGPEIQELLGIIRTQELLAARSIDGGNQLFTRANDFGYSKNPEETFDIWGKDEILSDVVWAIRKWRPDVIVNRFSHDSGRRTHGHHTGSAILAVEAFDLAADPNVFPDQLQYVEPWQPKRIFFNTSWWFYGSQENFKKADKSKMLSVDIGTYFPVKGLSNTEIAAKARSQHMAQGFGSIGTRGEQVEYLQLIKGEMPGDKENIFEGVNTTWTRVEGGAPVGVILRSVEQNFQFDNPAASIPKLLEAYELIKALPDGYWKKAKQEEIEEIIQACLGLFSEAIAEQQTGVPGQNIGLDIEATNRSTIPVILKSIQLLPTGKDTMLNLDLGANRENRIFTSIALPQELEITNAYWLNQEWEKGRYNVKDRQLIGLPETPKVVKVIFNYQVDGKDLSVEKEVIHKFRDRVYGEVYQPFEVIPPAFANLVNKVFVFADDQPQTVEVLIKAGKANAEGEASISAPLGWTIKPATIPFKFSEKGAEKTIQFEIYPPDEQAEGYIAPLLKIDGERYSKEVVLIDYNHFPLQTVLRDSKAKVVKIDIRKEGEKIGYIMGLGDDIPASLSQIGYEVTLLNEEDVSPENLEQYDAIVLGVRAYNGSERMKFYQEALHKYVEKGGTLVCQYNKSYGLTVPGEKITPYSLEISRDRVTVEEAPVTFLEPEHPVLNYPNKITEKDFEGWVQERGLYFPDEWDDAFTPILASNDPGESPKKGGLLVASYGKGHYIYTGYAWFRQLPNGVPGAFRIFANMLSIGKTEGN